MLFKAHLKVNKIKGDMVGSKPTWQHSNKEICFIRGKSWLDAPGPLHHVMGWAIAVATYAALPYGPKLITKGSHCWEKAFRWIISGASQRRWTESFAKPEHFFTPNRGGRLFWIDHP